MFHRGAVGELARNAPDASLERQSRDARPPGPDPPRPVDFAGDEAYRFRHVLIRDAAYRSLLEERAGRSARALRRLARAHGRRTGCASTRRSSATTSSRRTAAASALGSRDDARRALAARRPSGSRLGRAAGARPQRPARGDRPARAGVRRSLPADDPRRTALLAELGAALIEAGRLADAERVLDEASGWPRSRPATSARRRTCSSSSSSSGSSTSRRAGRRRPRAPSARVIPVFERHGDELGLCRARRLEAWLHWNEARAEAAAEAWERAAAHASRAGDEHAHDEILTWIASSLWFGPTPGRRGHPPLRGDARRGARTAPRPRRRPCATSRACTRWSAASISRRALLATSNAAYADLGLTLNAATSQNEAVVELLAGDPAAAETSLRAGLSSARGDGRAGVPLDDCRVPRAGGLRAGPHRRGRGARGAERQAGGARRPADAAPLARRARARAGDARAGSTRPRRSRARRCHSQVRPTSSSSTVTPSSTWHSSCGRPGATRKRPPPPPRACIFMSKRAISSPPGESGRISVPCCSRQSEEPYGSEWW